MRGRLLATRRRPTRFPLRTMLVRSDGLENPDVDIDDVDDENIGAIEGFGSGWPRGNTSSSGIRVSRSKAMTYSPWWRGINLLSRDVAKLPLHVYKKTDEENKERDRKHPSYLLLRRKPNPYMTAFVWKQVGMYHVLSEGNHYAYIFRDGNAKPIEILPLCPESTWPVLEDGNLWYVTLVNKHIRKLNPWDVLHWKNLGHDGLMGHSALDKARETLGLGIATRTFGSTYFRNGTRTSGILMYPQHLKEDAIKRMKREWNTAQSGLTNAHKVAILQEGAKYMQMSTNPDDAQFIDTRQFEYREVANFLGVPSHKLGDKQGQAYNSLEQENQAYLDESLDPWLVMIEEECADKLLTEEEKRDESHFMEFQRKALVRANMSDRFNAYKSAIDARWMLPDEARAAENMNALPNGEGKKLASPPNQSLKPPAKGEAKMRRAVARFTADAAERMAKRIGTHARKAAKQPGTFALWVERELPTHAPVVEASLRPAFDNARYAQRAAARFLKRVRRELLAASESSPAELAAAVDQTLRRLEGGSPAFARHLLKGENRVRTRPPVPAS